MVKHSKIIFGTAILAIFTNLQADVADEEELTQSYGDDYFVSIATGRKQSLAKAPAVASVISSDEIKAIGARDLDEILETIPGIHAAVASGAYNSVYVVRGIYSEINPQVLMLINGVPVTNTIFGNRSVVWGGMPVENISRVEVIRGPGSAVYGADAFAATINIVTKTADEIDGFETGVSYGSFNEKRLWAQYGNEWNGWNIAASLQLLDTDGQTENIDIDAQSSVDALFGTSASLAPGDVNTGRESADIRLDLSKGNWRLRLGYQERNDIESGAGGGQALDSKGIGDSKRINFDITYQNLEFGKNIELESRLSYFDVTTETNITLSPPGTDFPVFPPFPPTIDFPDGVIGNPDSYERDYRLDTSLFFTGIEDHDIRVGVGYHYIDQYRLEEERNFVLQPVPLSDPTIFVPVPLGGVIEITGDALFNREEEREVTYAFVQDEWKLARDWALTLGVRYDSYSDFGDTVNPRAALVWNTSYKLTSKLLYGRAFRAPSFAEQFNQNNPVAIGNDSLDPEVINTYELAFDYAYSSDLRIGLNFYYYEFEDIIRFTTTTAQNTGDQTGHGIEMEFDWDINSDFKLKGNYAYQESEDEETGSDAANAPGQQIYLRGEYRLIDNWVAYLQANYVADRKRAAGDGRSDIDDYTTLDFTLRGMEVLPGLDVALSARNLTNESVREPSLFTPGTGAAIPNDLPQAKRAVFIEIRKTWR